jgi:hypothetical protein
LGAVLYSRCESRLMLQSVRATSTPIYRPVQDTRSVYGAPCLSQAHCGTLSRSTGFGNRKSVQRRIGVLADSDTVVTRSIVGAGQEHLPVRFREAGLTSECQPQRGGCSMSLRFNIFGKRTVHSNGAVNLTAAVRSALCPLMLPAVSMLVKPMEIPVRRPQVTPGALDGALISREFTDVMIDLTDC